MTSNWHYFDFLFSLDLVISADEVRRWSEEESVRGKENINVKNMAKRTSDMNK